MIKRSDPLIPWLKFLGGGHEDTRAVMKVEILQEKGHRVIQSDLCHDKTVDGQPPTFIEAFQTLY